VPFQSAAFEGSAAEFPVRPADCRLFVDEFAELQLREHLLQL